MSDDVIINDLLWQFKGGDFRLFQVLGLRDNPRHGLVGPARTLLPTKLLLVSVVPSGSGQSARLSVLPRRHRSVRTRLPPGSEGVSQMSAVLFHLIYSETILSRLLSLFIGVK
jgi:hypothetical protein